MTFACINKYDVSEEITAVIDSSARGMISLWPEQSRMIRYGESPDQRDERCGVFKERFARDTEYLGSCKELM